MASIGISWIFFGSHSWAHAEKNWRSSQVPSHFVRCILLSPASDSLQISILLNRYFPIFCSSDRKYWKITEEKKIVHKALRVVGALRAELPRWVFSACSNCWCSFRVKSYRFSFNTFFGTMPSLVQLKAGTHSHLTNCEDIQVGKKWRKKMSVIMNSFEKCHIFWINFLEGVPTDLNCFLIVLGSSLRYIALSSFFFISNRR